MYELNDRVTLKKPHPCGGREWEIVRVGADIKLRCLTCGRFLNVTRDELKKRAKALVKKDGEGV
ncbi:MAG: DUF951 domain-containing protein [Clostridia bacterium]|nr:DUF951 domain-containing protein [Clostridia bacterium]